MLGPLVESVPADCDGSIDADKQEERTFGNDLQILLCPYIHGDKVVAPSLRDELCHFHHRLEPDIACPISVHSKVLDPTAHGTGRRVLVLVRRRRVGCLSPAGRVVIIIAGGRCVRVTKVQPGEAVLGNEVLCNRPLASTYRACNANEHPRGSSFRLGSL